MRSSNLIQAAAVFVVLAVLLLGSLEGPRIGQQLGFVERDPVLVFVIPDLHPRHRVRTVIAKDRVIYANDVGMAVRGHWVLASNHDVAGQLIVQAGWVDHPIKMMTLVADPAAEEAAAARAGGGMSRAERLAQLRRLVNKPSLTRAEQVFVLKAMNDGIEL